MLYYLCKPAGFCSLNITIRRTHPQQKKGSQDSWSMRVYLNIRFRSGKIAFQHNPDDLAQGRGNVRNCGR